jgi:phenylalanyl-tRNA synthetase beta chain
VIQGIRVGPSPAWLRDRLESIGIRSINNVVDITNYVLMETGQPLHAFDYHLVSREADGPPTIIVRRARPQEPFTTLDGQTHTLGPDMLLIADGEKGIALAGVMGGENSEIKDKTTDVLLESAWFLPANIRRASRELGLRTDASYRFERGADIGITDWASRRAAHLIQDLAGGQLAEGVVDAYPQPFTPRQVTLRHAKVNQLLGVQLGPEEMDSHLVQLGLKIVGRKPRPVDAPPAAPEPTTFSIPTWRPDLKRETDLIEEIARLHGVDQIPSTPPRGAIGSNSFDTVHDQHAEARNLLVGLGLLEAQGQTLVSDAAARWVTDHPVMLDNPLSSDMSALRPSLLPGLLDSLRHNANRQSPDVALFEIGRVFCPHQSQVREERRVALALVGQTAPSFWQGGERETPFDIYDLKGLMEVFLERFGLRGLVFVRRDQPTNLLAESAAVTLGGKVQLGELGQLQPHLAQQLDLRYPVFLGELNLDRLLSHRLPIRQFKSLPAHPAVRRDVALLVPDSVTHEAVLATIRKTKPAHLERVELFDVFRGKNVPAQHKSVAYALTYRSAERTLTDAEVNAQHEKVVEQIKTTLPATVRE